MNRGTLALTLGLLLGSALTSPAMAQTGSTAIPEQEAQAIAVDVYVYLYPLVTMDVTRRQFTNIEPGKELGKGPMNMFHNVPEYPPADFKGVVRPNFDTLYSIAYLDTTKEPILFPCRIPMGATISCHARHVVRRVRLAGWRTGTGTQAAEFPRQRPRAGGGPARTVRQFSYRGHSVSRHRRPSSGYQPQTDGPPDYDAVRKIRQADAAPLSEWGDAKPVEARSIKYRLKTPPNQVDAMSAANTSPMRPSCSRPIRRISPTGRSSRRCGASGSSPARLRHREGLLGGQGSARDRAVSQTKLMNGKSRHSRAWSTTGR
jgi:hypothetical protein